MFVHIALFKWKSGIDEQSIVMALKEVEALKDKIPGLLEISTGKNTSQYSEGYTHVVLVRAETQGAITTYRKHPGHIAVAIKIEAMEEKGIGVDFETKA